MVYSAPLLIEFFKGQRIFTPEVKQEGMPYVASKEEFVIESVSAPMQVFAWKVYGENHYGIQANAFSTPYLCETTLFIKEKKLMIIDDEEQFKDEEVISDEE